MKKLLFVLLTALFAGTVTAQIPSVSILGDSYSTYEDFVTPAARRSAIQAMMATTTVPVPSTPV